MRTLKFLTILSFLNTIGIIIVSPFEDFENNKLVGLLPLIFGLGCVIQLIALFFARQQWKNVQFVHTKIRTFYTIVLSVSFSFTIIWMVIAVLIYVLGHLFDGVGPLNFGPK
jgi:uncharacterized membrane protein